VSWKIIAIIISLCMAGVNLAFVLTRQKRMWKKPLRFYMFLIGLYFAGIYSFALTNTTSPILRNGMLTISGVVMLLLGYIAEVIADWRLEIR
jgi:hypothetical protein